MSESGKRSGRWERASGRFSAYFAELRGAFLERDEVLAQIALALLSREHVLLVGPPGTAKSQLARAVLGRILDEATGEPSLFARQFTENTVLTDLVGPIDFKTLMETGRSQHFTDEGVIGSVHAFLDEVFDGRDMLLRSTLNLLGERELKQGKSTVRGRIECSLMTSNRYLTEVLDESRESLLAFVDRIAFVGFVPKGFAEQAAMQQVMRQALSTGAAPLHAYLTIQDLDVLQEGVDRMRLPPEACDRLVAFLATFEAEMAAAVRATADFAPSRYLSIRTRVRAGRLLKAIVVYRKVIEDPARPLEVTADDFAYLRLALLQSGPPSALLERLAQEQDPREARQLKIIKTEREVFERCLAQLDRSPFRPAAPNDVALAPETWATATFDDLLALWERAADAGLDEEDERVAQLSQLVISRVIEQGLSLSRFDEDATDQHAQLLEKVERRRGPVDPLVRFLRGRGVQLLESNVERQILALEALSEARAGRSAAEMIELLGPVVDRLQLWFDELERVRRSAPQLSIERLRQLLISATSALTNRLREGFLVEARRLASQEAWDAASPEGARLLTALGAVHELEARLVAIYPAFSQLLDGVVAPAVLPIVRRALLPLALAPQHELLPRFDTIWAELGRAQLARHVPFDEILRSVLEQAATADRVAEPRLPLTGYSSIAHDELRRSLPRTLLCFIAVQLCLRLDPECARRFSGDPGLLPFAERVARLPESQRLELRQFDVKRLRVWCDFLRGWLTQAEATAATPGDLFALLGVLEEAGAATRLRLETELIEALLPDAATECQALRDEVDGILLRARQVVTERGQA